MKVEATMATKKDRTTAHILMVLLVINWGIDYSMAKNALELLDPLQIVFFKYLIAFCIFLIIKIAKKIKLNVTIRVLPIFILCAITGEILYYLCEYMALDYLPVSMVTIMLTFTPMLSVGIERLLYKIKSNWKINIGILISIVGVGFIIGLEFGEISGRTLIGYGLCIGAIISWNAYNFLTSKLRGDYHTVTVGFTQICCTAIICAPLGLRNLPSIELVTFDVVGSVLYLGILSGGLGFFCYIYAIGKLGPTTNAVYSNFLPVTATFFGWLFLGETLGIWQIMGGIIVITAGCFVIREKGKIDKERLENQS